MSTTTPVLMVVDEDGRATAAVLRWSSPPRRLRPRMSQSSWPRPAPVLRAIAHGLIDTYLPAPGPGRDEGIHRGLSELLEEWAQQAEPAVPAVRIIDQAQSARSHELGDLLDRNSIPHLFHDAASADGRAWLLHGRTRDSARWRVVRSRQAASGCRA